MKQTILDQLAESTRKYPDFKVFYDKTTGEWKGITFKELEQKSDFVAASLLELGYNQQSKFGILSEGRINWIVAELGVHKIRAIAVPLSVKLLPEEIIFRMNHSEADAIFVSANYADKVLSIAKDLKPDFKFIFFDKGDNRIEKAIEKYNIDRKNILYYDDLMALASDAYQKHKDLLEQLRASVQEDDVTVIIYTSGTTGDPKGVMLTQKNFWNNAYWAYKHFRGFPQFCKSLVILPIDHSFAHTAQIYTAIIIPYTVYFLDSRGGGTQAIRNIPINLREVKPYFLLTVPALTGNFMKKINEQIRQQPKFVQWLFKVGLEAGMKKIGDAWKNRPNFIERAFLSLPHGIANMLIFSKIRKSFGNYKFSISGGAYLDPYQQQFFAAIGMRIYQGYGLSENSPIISTNGPYLWKIGTTGHPLPVVKVKIINNGKEMGPNQKGEIVVSGPCVMKGYYKNPEATAKTIRDGWLYTGDIGYIDEDGFLVVSGREKALLISQDGEKYSPEEIEETIMSYSPFVNQIMLYNEHFKYTVAIITLDLQYLKEYLKAHKNITPEHLLKVITDSLMSFRKNRNLKNKFPSRWLPSVFAIVPEPFSEENKMLNSTMKIIRHRIVEAYHDLIEIMKNDETKNQIIDYNLKTLEKLMSQVQH